MSHTQKIEMRISASTCNEQLGCCYVDESDSQVRVVECPLHSAAPELLRALKKFVKAYKERGEFGADIVTDALDVIRQAEKRG